MTVLDAERRLPKHQRQPKCGLALAMGKKE
jgi:hypothetical protein